MSVLQSKINVEIDEDLWSKFGPYSCTLNIDEVDDIEKEWCNLADKMGEPVDKVKHSI